MQSREKILFFVLISIAVGYFVLPRIYGWAYGPIRDLEDRREGLAMTVSDKEVDEIRLIQARGRIQDWQRQALPPDPKSDNRPTANDAQRLYVEWLTDLAQLSGWKQAKVSPDRTTSRRNAYVQVDVTLSARVKFAELCRFLYHFERANLLHRVGYLSAEPESSVGDPWLEVTLRAEGLALQGGQPRQTLFPRTVLSTPLDATVTSPAVATVAGFPAKPPFRVRLEGEYCLVTEVEKNRWTLVRGADQTTASAHPSGTIVELAPVAAEAKDIQFDDYAALIEDSPFLKARVRPSYEPRLEFQGSSIVVRGTPWSPTVEVVDRDPSLPPLRYALKSAGPDGLKLDAESGRISWDVPDSLEAGKYVLDIVANSANPHDAGNSAGAGDAGQDVLALQLPIELREPNVPPSVTVPERIAAVLGQRVSLNVEAVDPDGDDRELSFQLAGSVPENMSIDSRTGRIDWSVPETTSPNIYTVEVQVVDAGTPPQMSRRTVRFDVRDDMARFTYLIAAGKRDGETEAWLFNRLRNERTTIREGDLFRVAEIEGDVELIDNNRVVLRRDDGYYQLDLGSNVRSLRPIRTPPELKASEAPEPDGTNEK